MILLTRRKIIDIHASPEQLIKLEKALKRLYFKAFIWWSIAGSNR